MLTITLVLLLAVVAIMFVIKVPLMAVYLETFRYLKKARKK
jgi:hypothetical protein